MDSLKNSLQTIKVNYNPDVLTCLSNLSNDEVFTPPEVVNKILDLLPDSLWRDKEAKFLDPVCKSGVFLREIAKRLNVGLSNLIPDQQDRLNHIFKNQIFGIAITELTSLLSRRSVYCSKIANNKYSICENFDTPQGNILFRTTLHKWKNDKCVYCGTNRQNFDENQNLETHAYEFIHNNNLKDIFGVEMKFDVIIGNPPYQLESGGFGAQATPIYQLFVEQAKKLRPKYISFVIPSRWFAGGLGLDTFRKNMLSDRSIKTIVDYPDSTECFPGVDIAGGVCYFLWDSSYSGDCNFISIQGKSVSKTIRNIGHYNVLIRHNASIPILNKVEEKTEEWLSEKVSSINVFGLSTNFNEFDNDGEIIVYGRNQTRNKITKSKIDRALNLIDCYKVVLGQAYGERGSYPFLITGKPFIIGPGTCCTATYLVIENTLSKDHAENIKNYLQTRFCRFLISLRKNTQHLHAERFGFVPLLDWSIKWSDKDLYKKYNLTSDEISYIELMIRPMELTDEQ